MKYCSKCGVEVPAEARFCPTCGNVMPLAVPTPEDPYLNRTLDGKFMMQELLGIGGMGRVYKAVQLSLDKQVCVKVLRTGMMQDDTLVRRFQREARAASRLNHPNSITVIDFGQAAEDGALYLAMEYVPGKDLSKLIQVERPFSEERIVHLMDQVLSALADAHAAGIVHRDLKPENIMVTHLRGTRDFVKVLDFGIAKIQESTKAEAGLTQAGMVCGTPEYMSPEQARGEELDARSDIYAAGVILYQMVTGRLPFVAPTAMGIVTKHLIEPPVPPSQIQGISVSAYLESVILKAMSKDREGRQPTALALLQELNGSLSLTVCPGQESPLENSLFADEPNDSGSRAEGGAPLQLKKSRPVQAATPKPDRGGRRWWLAILAGLVMLGGGGAAAYFLWWVPEHSLSTVGSDANLAGVMDAGVAAAESSATPGVLPGGESLQANAAEVVDAGIATTAEPNNEMADLAFQTGKELVAQGKIEKAVVFFEKAIKQNPALVNAYKFLGMCYTRLGNVPEAKRYYQLYLDKAPQASDRQAILDTIQSL